jgi:DNA-binding MarR family transcriptional regulator
LKKLATILGYQLDITAQAALRSLHRFLADDPLTPPCLTALLHVRDVPGCDQTSLGRALAGNRSLGMKIASMLETQGLLIRSAGRDRRSKGLHITEEGRRVLADAVRRHERAERAIAAGLAPGERDMLLKLLAKVQQAVAHEEAVPQARIALSDRPGQSAPPPAP